MKKISEYENEDALDLLADIIEPTAKIFSSDDLRKAVTAGENQITCIKVAIKNNKKEIIEILARLEGVKVKDYKCNLISLITDLMNILNDEDLKDFFTSQQQMMES